MNIPDKTAKIGGLALALAGFVASPVIIYHAKTKTHEIYTAHPVLTQIDTLQAGVWAMIREKGGSYNSIIAYRDDKDFAAQFDTRTSELESLVLQDEARDARNAINANADLGLYWGLSIAGIGLAGLIAFGATMVAKRK